MRAKKWLTIYFLFNLTIVILIQSILMYNDIPPRFSNSISYNAKLHFIKKNKLLKDANTLIIGSSMALNNISGITLEDNSKEIKKVANLASWGLNSIEVAQFLKLINLKKIKYIIYSTEYNDFAQIEANKEIDINSTFAYLNNQFILKPYIKRFTTTYKNMKKYFFYKQIYLTHNSYSSLLFDRTGSVNFIFSKKYYKKKRWNQTYEYNSKLSTKSFEAIREIADIAKLHHIKLITATAPIRLGFLKTHPIAQKKTLTYIEKLKKISEEKSFIYINAHKILQLDDKYFVGATHLNRDGAILFSKMILEKSKIL
jgi:hypothetical protein